jgi:hypothetical protein
MLPGGFEHQLLDAVLVGLPFTESRQLSATGARKRRKTGLAGNCGDTYRTGRLLRPAGGTLAEREHAPGEVPLGTQQPQPVSVRGIAATTGTV